MASLSTSVISSSKLVAKEKKSQQKKATKKKSKSSYARSRSRKRRRESKKAWPEESLDSEGFHELNDQVNALYETPIQKPEKLMILLQKFSWNKFKVVDYIKKNKLYYRRFLDSETGGEQGSVLSRKSSKGGSPSSYSQSNYDEQIPESNIVNNNNNAISYN